MAQTVQRVNEKGRQARGGDASKCHQTDGERAKEKGLFYEFHRVPPPSSKQSLSSMVCERACHHLATVKHDPSLSPASKVTVSDELQQRRAKGVWHFIAYQTQSSNLILLLFFLFRIYIRLSPTDDFGDII